MSKLETLKNTVKGYMPSEMPARGALVGYGFAAVTFGASVLTGAASVAVAATTASLIAGTTFFRGPIADGISTAKDKVTGLLAKNEASAPEAGKKAKQAEVASEGYMAKAGKTFTSAFSYFKSAPVEVQAEKVSPRRSARLAK